MMGIHGLSPSIALSRMSKNFPFSVIFSTLLLFAISAPAQTQILKKYPFEKGGYALVGMPSESDRNGLADTLGTFYTDDIPTLLAIQKAWTFKKPSPRYACGYHYDIAICKQGLQLESFGINLNCHELATDTKSFYFDPQLLRKFKDRLQTAYEKDVRFSTPGEARRYRDSVLRESSLLVAPSHAWETYEGSFQFELPCPPDKKSCFDREAKLLAKLTNEIRSKYPDEPFQLEGAGGSLTELTVEVMCNKSLSDKFDLYPRGRLLNTWHPFEYSLTTYWKSKSSGQ